MEIKVKSEQKNIMLTALEYYSVYVSKHLGNPETAAKIEEVIELLTRGNKPEE